MSGFTPAPDNLRIPADSQAKLVQSLTHAKARHDNVIYLAHVLVTDATHMVRNLQLALTDLTLKAYPFHVWLRTLYSEIASPGTGLLQEHDYEAHILVPFVECLAKWTTLLTQNMTYAQATNPHASQPPPPRQDRSPSPNTHKILINPANQALNERDEARNELPQVLNDHAMPAQQPNRQGPAPCPEVRASGALTTVGLDPTADHDGDTMRIALTALAFSKNMLDTAQLRKLPAQDVMLIKFESTDQAKAFLKGKGRKLAALPKVSVNFVYKYAHKPETRLAQCRRRFEKLQRGGGPHATDTTPQENPLAPPAQAAAGGGGQAVPPPQAETTDMSVDEARKRARAHAEDSE